MLIPTRSRPKRFRHAVESGLKTKTGRIEFVGYVDDNDPLLHEYEKIELPDTRLIVGPRMGLARIIHRLIDSSLYSYLFLGADDIEFKTVGWDEKMAHAIPEDCIGLVACEDNWKQTFNHMMFHQKWVSLTGLFPDDFEHWGPDTYMKTVAEGVKRCYFLKDVVIEHHHFKNLKGKLDSTYQECRADNTLDRDKKRLKDYEHRMKRDIEVLKEYL